MKTEVVDIEEKNELAGIDPYDEISDISKKRKNRKKHFDLDFFEY